MQPEFLLVDLPSPLATFRSAHSIHPPFYALLQHLERVSERPLGFLYTAVSRADFADLRQETRAWLATRARLGLDLPANTVDLLSVEGMTAPVIKPKLKPGHALVYLGGAA